MKIRRLALMMVVLFSVANWCNAQETSSETQSLSPGERLRRVEETLQLLQTRKQRPDVDVLRKLEAELKAILVTDSVFKSQIEADLEIVHESLAYHDLQVAAYFMSNTHGHSWRGAASRLQNITKRYPKFSKMDEVLFHLIDVSVGQEQKDLAVRYCWSLICNYPNSEYVKAAFDHLNRIGVNSWEGCQKFKLP